MHSVEFFGGEGLYVHASLIDVASSSFSPFSLCGRRCDVNDMRDAVAYLHAIDVAISRTDTRPISPGMASAAWEGVTFIDTTPGAVNGILDGRVTHTARRQ